MLKYSDIINPQVIEQRHQANPFEQLRVIVRDMLEEAITKLVFVPGEKINMVSLAQVLGISRTPVREALNMLVDEGIVVIRPEKNGYFVPDITDDFMKDLFGARSAIETAAVSICARNFLNIDLSSLRSMVQVFRSCVETQDMETFSAADRKFHTAIVEFSGNRFLIDFYRQLQRSLDYYNSLVQYRLGRIASFNTDIFRRMTGDHLAIFAAIEKGQSHEAEILVQRHLDSCFYIFSKYQFARTNP